MPGFGGLGIRLEWFLLTEDFWEKIYDLIQGIILIKSAKYYIDIKFGFIMVQNSIFLRISAKYIELEFGFEWYDLDTDSDSNTLDSIRIWIRIKIDQV